MDPNLESVIFPFDSVDLDQQYSAPSACQSNASNTKEERSNATNRSKNWTSNEDVALCKAWAITSLDPEEGDSQKRATYWGRIFMNFKEDIKEATGMETTRNQSACERRWGIIQHDVNKFCAAYDQATSTHLTGRVQLDVLEVAHQIYAATNDKKRFTLEHAWAILRQHVKWSLYRSQLEKNNKSVSVKRSTKKKPTTSDFMSPNPQSATITLDQDQSSTPINDTSEIKEPTRPIGRKAAKAAKASEAAESKKRSNDVGADIAAANMKLANASNAKVKIAAIAVADARQALDDKIMLNSAPQNLDEIQMEYWRERRAQIAKRLHQKNSEISISGNDAEGVAE